MANDNVIDQLSLQIDANANAAIKSVSELQRQLRNLAKSVGSVASVNRGLVNLSTSLSKIGRTDLSRTVTQLEKLQHMNFKNIDGKTIKLDVQISGADKAERLKYALDDAVKGIDTRKIAKQINDAFDFKGDMAKKVKASIDDALSNVKPSENVQGGLLAGVMGIIEKNPAKVYIDKANFDEYIARMKSEYTEFLDYFKSHKIQLTQGVDKKILNQNMSANERMTYFSKAGSSLDSRWEEIISKFPTIASGFRSITNEEEQVYAVLNMIREATNGLAKTSLSSVQSGDASDNAWMHVIDKVNQVDKQIVEKLQSGVDQAMKESATKVPLDVMIDPQRIESQIANAVKQAASRKYDLDIQFAVNTQTLKHTVSTALGEIDVSQMGNLSSHLQEASRSLADIGKVNFKENGVNAFVNSVKRLGEVDLSNFSTDTFQSIITGIAQIAGSGDISSSVNKLVASLAKLANAGENTKATATNLPALGNAIKTVAGHLSSVGGLSAELNAFVGSIAQLANAGKRTEVTAENLGELGNAVSRFITRLAEAPQVSSNILSMVEAIAQLASAGGKAGTAARSINKSLDNAGKDSEKTANRLNALKDILNDLGGVFSKVGGIIKSGASKIVSAFTQIKSSGNGLGSVGANVKTLLATLIGFRGIQGLVSVAKQTVMLGADLTEIDHIVESVFGDMAETVDRWAKSAISSFGIAEHSAKRYAGVLSSMFQASGVGYKDAGLMGIRLTELAGDLSAFYNIDTETAFNKIRSGMAGMVRPLRDLGIDLTAATLEEFRLAQGIQTSYSQMSQAEKVMLRYQYLMHNTTTQQGDFQRTSLSLANSLRTLKAYAQAVGTQIGTGLASAIRHVVVWLNQMMKYVLKASQAFATFMQTIFGKYKGGASGIAFDATAMEEDVGNVADAADGIGEGLDNASDSAKQLKKDLSVLPFDELNQLNKDREEASSGSGSGGTGGAGGAGGLGDGLLDWGDLLENSEAGKLPDWISAWGKRIKAAFFSQDWTRLGETLAEMINKGIDAIYDALNFENFKKKVDPFITGFVRTFNTLISNVDWNLLGRTIGEFVNDMVYSMNRLLTEINWEKIGKSIASFANGLVDEIDFKEVGRLIGNKFMVLWRTLYGFATDFDWKKFGKKLADGINGINDSINLSDVSRALTTFLNGIFTTLKELADKIEWGDIVENISSGINTFIKEFHWKENGQALGSFIRNLLDALIQIVEKTNWTDLGRGISTMLQQLPWDKLLEAVGKVFIKAIGGVLVGMATTPAQSFGGALIKALIAFKIGSTLLPFVGNIITALTGQNVATMMSTAGSRLMTYFGASIGQALPAIGGAITSALGSIVSGIGTAITTIGGILAAITPAGWITIAVIAGVTLLTVQIIRHWDDVKKGLKKVGDAIVKGWQWVKGQASEIWGSIKSTAVSVKDGFATAMGNMKTTGVEAWKTLSGKAKEFFGAISDKATSTFDTVKNKASSASEYIKTNVPIAWNTAKQVVSQVSREMLTTVQQKFGQIETKARTVFESVKSKITTKWDEIKRKTDSAVDSMYNKVNQKFSSIGDKFKTTMDSMATKAKEKFDTITGKIGEAYSSLKETFGSKWKLDIDNSRPKIPVPHFTKTGSFSLNPPRVPTYSFSGWWKKGGLFKGGSGSIIGVAEGGRDEAVLPLENSKAMSKIGGAIANASSGVGITKEDVVEAVVTAMALNPMTQEVIVNAVLKMENDEVLARHVERGRRRMDQRFNPVASY